MNITRRQVAVGGLSLLAGTALNSPSQAQPATEGVINLSDPASSTSVRGRATLLSCCRAGASQSVIWKAWRRRWLMLVTRRFASTSEVRARVPGRERTSLFTHWARMLRA